MARTKFSAQSSHVDNQFKQRAHGRMTRAKASRIPNTNDKKHKHFNKEALMETTKNHLINAWCTIKCFFMVVDGYAEYIEEYGPSSIWKMDDTWTSMIDGEEITSCKYDQLVANRDRVEEILRSIETLQSDIENVNVANMPNSFILATMEKTQRLREEASKLTE